MIPDRPRPAEKKEPGPITAADKLRARLGDIDETIAAGIGDS